MKPFQTSLIHVLLGTACLSSAIACSGDDGADEPSQTTEGGVPFAPSTAGVANAGVVGQPSASMQQPDGVMGQVSPSMDLGGAMGQPSADLGGGAMEATVSYSADLGDLFSARCGGCHSFWVNNDDAAYIRSFDLGDIVLAAVTGPFTDSSGGSQPIMPYSCGVVGQGSCLSQDEVDLIAAWVDGGFEM